MCSCVTRARPLGVCIWLFGAECLGRGLPPFAGSIVTVCVQCLYLKKIGLPACVCVLLLKHFAHAVSSRGFSSLRARAVYFLLVILFCGLYGTARGREFVWSLYIAPAAAALSLLARHTIVILRARFNYSQGAAASNWKRELLSSLFHFSFVWKSHTHRKGKRVGEFVLNGFGI